MPTPEIFRAEEANFLSNAYLIADRESGKGVLVDSNGATDPLAEVAERDGIEITHLLLTHHHYDHVVGCEALAERFGVGIWGHEGTKEEVGAVTDVYGEGDVISSGGLEIKPLFTPGHCADLIAPSRESMAGWPFTEFLGRTIANPLLGAEICNWQARVRFEVSHPTVVDWI